MNATPTTVAYFNDEDNQNQADNSDELEAFLSGVSVGDYITVAYKTPSNGGSIHRTMGHVENIRTVNGHFDDLHFEVEDTDRDEAGETAYLHVHPDSGSYYFSDNPDTEEDWGVSKVAWTPEN